MNIEDHPTVKRMRAIADARIENEKDGIDAAWLRQLARDCGADDAGLVEIKSARARLPEGRASASLSLDQDTAGLRRPHEPGADPQPGALGR